MKLRPLLAIALLASSAVVAACSSSSDNTCSSTGQALTVCATGKTVKGVDVSVYQGTVTWSSVKNAGVVFGIARVSDGTGTLDSTFATNWKNMKSNGIVRGVYQFFEPGEDPTQQANLVISQVKSAGGFDTGDLPPVMDMEVTGGQTDATIQSHMQTWLDAIEKAVGRKPLIYTNESTSSHFGGKFTSYPLWVASWGASCPTMPNGFAAWEFWQNADDGSVSGISGAVDTDEFNGTLADLQSWANPNPPPPADAGAPSDAGAKDAGSASDAAPAEDASAPPPSKDAGEPPNPCAP